MGYEIIVFARGVKEANLRCRVIQPYPVFESTFLRWVSLVVVLPALFLRAPRIILRLWQLERKEGKSWTAIVKILYLNAHILPYDLDWLHFGFATLCTGKENVAKAIEAKLAVSFRGYDINVYPLKHPDCYLSLWKRLDKVHSISQYLMDRARVYGLPDSITTQMITPAVSPNLPIKTNFEFGQPLHLMTVARLTWIKGLSYTLQAVAILKTQGVDIHYTIVGDGPDREHLLHEIHALGLTDDVTFAGRLSHSDTVNRMLKSDIYVQPSLNEGFCNAVLEAQAVGCLCIASRVGGLVENIEHGVTGWLFEPRNPLACSEAVIRLMGLSMEERITISSQARQRASSHFQMDSHLLQWKSFYEL